MSDAVGELRFKVEVLGVTIGRFMECTGLAVEYEVVEHVEGGLNDHVHKLRGHAKHPNLTLKRGVTDEEQLLRWVLDCQAGTKRHDIQVQLKAPDGKTVRTWTLEGAWPVKWQGPALNAGSANVATESLEIAHRGLKRV